MLSNQQRQEIFSDEVNMSKLELAKMQVEIAKIMEETIRMQKESKKIVLETAFYPFVAGAGSFAAIAGVVIACMKYL